MGISWSVWEQAQCNLVQDFIDLFLPPRYPFSVEAGYPRTSSMEALIKDRFNTLELPESKLLRFGELMQESCLEDFPDKCADFAVLYGCDVLEGFGHGLACSLQGAAFEGLKQLATTWGLYLAKEMERLFHVWQLFTTFTDFLFDLLSIFCQIPAKELGEAIRESITPAYLRAGETVTYELALLDNDPGRMKESLGILEASDTELQGQITNMFSGYSSEQLGRQMQRMLMAIVSRLRELFDSSKFKNEFGEKLPAAALVAGRNMSWYIGRRLSQNLQQDPQRTNRLLEAVNHHKEIAAVFEQYRYRHSWGGDRTKAIRLGWQVVAPRYFGLSGQIERIREDEQQEKLIGVAEGLEDYTNKNPAIVAMEDAFLGKLGAYLMTAAKNQERDYLRKQTTDGNRISNEAQHAEDFRHAQAEEEEEESDEEILSGLLEKHHPQGNPIVEGLESQETLEEWEKALTDEERTATLLMHHFGNQQKVAEVMGISQPRVSQLLGEAWRKYLKVSR